MKFNDFLVDVVSAGYRPTDFMFIILNASTLSVLRDELKSS